MGIVTDYLIELVHEQVEEKGIVVWFDPEKTYADLSKQLAVPQTQITRYEGSFLELRRSLDTAVNDVRSDIPPRLVIYVPLDHPATVHILDEFIYAGSVMQPGEAIPRNTSLGVIAREALRTIFVRERLDEISEDIRKGRITTLDELDRLAEKGDSGALGLVFDTNQTTEMVEKFILSEKYDAELSARDLVDELGDVLTELYGVPLPTGITLSIMRARLIKHLLLSDFLLRLKGTIPEKLRVIQFPESHFQQENCLWLVGSWRQRRDMQDAYLNAARQLEADTHLDFSGLEWDGLRDVETFPGAEARLQSCVASGLASHASVELVELAHRRRTSFWSEFDESFAAGWASIATAGELLLKTRDIQDALPAKVPVHAREMINKYSSKPDLWCHMDTLQRHMERLVQALDFDPAGKQFPLERLLVRARQEYTRTVDILATNFSSALTRDGFVVENMLYQIEVFSRFVSPALPTIKTAYVLVDALRFEMGLDLASSLDREWKVQVSPAIATPPTITPIGMASLLPGAERGISLAFTGDLAAEIGGQVLGTRQERLDYLKSKVTGLFDVKLEQLVPAKKSIRDALQAAQFIFVTSQEIDLLGEGDSVAQAREFMDHTLAKLARAFRVLADHGVKRIVVAADHGFIFTDELDADVTIPSPGGQTADLHRRVWIGKGGQSLYGVMRIPVEKLSLGGDYELATPMGLACFAAPGGKAFFHGGLSLQEMIIPVLVIEPEVALQPTNIEWMLILGREKITTRFCSVQVGGKVLLQSMFEGEPPLIRVEIRDANKGISAPVTATYGLREATGEVQMRWNKENPFELEGNTIALMISEDVLVKKVSIVLIDAETEVILKKLDADMAISI